MLLRSQGRAVWRRFNTALEERRAPTREVFDGAMVILGGALLLTPGFVTDVFGVLLLIPPTRDVAGRFAAWMVKRRTIHGRVAFWTFDRYNDTRDRGRPGSGHPPGAGPAPGGRPYDVEGTGREVNDEPSRQLPDADAER